MSKGWMADGGPLLAAMRNCLAELTFESPQGYRIPISTSMSDVEFAGPDGTARTVPAFWAGDNLWKVRFAGSREGRYEYIAHFFTADQWDQCN